MITGDGAYIKKINRSLILQEVMKNGFISRAELSKTTGLNKATISVQVQELLQKELVYETHHEHSTVGRRPIMLSINENAGFVLGIDLDQPYTHFSLSNLKGEEVEYKQIELETNDYDSIVKLLRENISYFHEKYSNSVYGLVRVVVAVHGIVNNDQFIHFIPKLQWRKKDLKADLRKNSNIDIHIQNNANLSAFAEYVHHQQSTQIITLTLTSAIGAGLIINGNIQRGYNGFAGEVGHMIIFPDGEPCPCGNKGCWGLYSSDSTALHDLSTLLNQPNLTFEDIGHLISKKDPITLNYLKDFIKSLSIGLNNLIHIYNPETIVLNSELLRLYPNTLEEIRDNFKPSIIEYYKIVISELGIKSTIVGACTWGISHFLDIPNFQIPQEKTKKV